MALKTYRDLTVWQKAMDLVVLTYTVTRQFPRDERFGLTTQSQRAAVSVAANIAEGYGRTHRGDYLHHLSVAAGSLAELETLLMIAVRLDYVAREKALEMWTMSQEVGKMLTALMRSLDTKSKRKGALSEP